jgi:hypothetical protein
LTLPPSPVLSSSFIFFLHLLPLLPSPVRTVFAFENYVNSSSLALTPFRPSDKQKELLGSIDRWIGQWMDGWIDRSIDRSSSRFWLMNLRVLIEQGLDNNLDRDHSMKRFVWTVFP